MKQSMGFLRSVTLSGVLSVVAIGMSGYSFYTTNVYEHISSKIKVIQNDYSKNTHSFALVNDGTTDLVVMGIQAQASSDSFFPDVTLPVGLVKPKGFDPLLLKPNDIRLVDVDLTPQEIQFDSEGKPSSRTAPAFLAISVLDVHAASHSNRFPIGKFVPAKRAHETGWDMMWTPDKPFTADVLKGSVTE